MGCPVIQSRALRVRRHALGEAGDCGARQPVSGLEGGRGAAPVVRRGSRLSREPGASGNGWRRYLIHVRSWVDGETRCAENAFLCERDMTDARVTSSQRAALAVAAGDEVDAALGFWLDEDLLGIVNLDHLA